MRAGILQVLLKRLQVRLVDVKCKKKMKTTKVRICCLFTDLVKGLEVFFSVDEPYCAQNGQNSWVLAVLSAIGLKMWSESIRKSSRLACVKCPGTNVPSRSNLYFYQCTSVWLKLDIKQTLCKMPRTSSNSSVILFRCTYEKNKDFK